MEEIFKQDEIELENFVKKMDKNDEPPQIKVDKLIQLLFKRPELREYFLSNIHLPRLFPKDIIGFSINDDKLSNYINTCEDKTIRKLICGSLSTHGMYQETKWRSYFEKIGLEKPRIFLEIGLKTKDKTKIKKLLCRESDGIYEMKETVDFKKYFRGKDDDKRLIILFY